MNPIALTIGVVLFVTGIILGRQSLSTTSGIKKITDNFLTPIHEITPTVIPTPTIQNESTPSATPTFSKAQIKTNPSPNLEDPTFSKTKFTYPNAKILHQTETEFSLESQDNTQQISSWYAELLKKEMFRSISQAKTNTNGKIVEKISASKDGLQISITINKNAESARVSIQVLFTRNSGSDDVRIEINEKNEGYL